MMIRNVLKLCQLTSVFGGCIRNWLVSSILWRELASCIPGNGIADDGNPIIVLRKLLG